MISLPSSRILIDTQFEWCFITCSTHKKTHWFSNPEFAQILLDQLHHYTKRDQHFLAAYSILPNHYHAVIGLSEHHTLASFLHGVHSYSTTLINRKLDREEKIRIWRGKTWTVQLYLEHMFWQKVAYTLLNPWRAGLVDSPYDAFPFSNLGLWIEREGLEFVYDLFAQYRRWNE